MSVFWALLVTKEDKQVPTESNHNRNDGRCRSLNMTEFQSFLFVWQLLRDRVN
jgi:hypothetical protein